MRFINSPQAVAALAFTAFVSGGEARANPTRTTLISSHVYARQVIDGCTFTWEAMEGDTCGSIAAMWGISEAQFIEYNPSVGADCSEGLVAGTGYCVEVNNGQPTTTIDTTTTSEPTTTTVPKPSPTQDGLTEDCKNPISALAFTLVTNCCSTIGTAYYKVVAGDNCPKIVSKYGSFTLEEL
jgi:hypothetical protein